MHAEHVRRIITVSAAPVGPVPVPGQSTPPRHDPGDGFFMRYLGVPLTRAMFGRHYADLADTEQTLRDSGLQWTVSRPPNLTDKPLTGRYRTAWNRNIRGGFSVPRADHRYRAAWTRRKRWESSPRTTTSCGCSYS